VIPYEAKFTAKLQNHFIVVHWDQRETGKTLSLNPSPTPLTVSLFQNDTHELIDQLLMQFDKQKLYLVGHSWGTVPGFFIARKYPSLLYAYIAIGPMINQLESENMALTLLKQEAEKAGDLTLMNSLSKIRIPFENGEQIFLHRSAILKHQNSKIRLLQRNVETWAVTWLQTFNEASRENLFETTLSFDCPVYFFAGKKDLHTNSDITRRYYEFVTAPKKNLFWFEHSGHFIPTSEPTLMQQIIIEKILPETIPIIRENSLSKQQ
jgi:pimeloyl-ACP methyl ester carboxylesterase